MLPPLLPKPLKTRLRAALVPARSVRLQPEVAAGIKPPLRIIGVLRDQRVIRPLAPGIRAAASAN